MKLGARMVKPHVATVASERACCSCFCKFQGHMHLAHAPDFAAFPPPPPRIYPERTSIRIPESRLVVRFSSVLRRSPDLELVSGDDLIILVKLQDYN